MAAIQEEQTATSKFEPVLTHQDVGSAYSSDQSPVAAATQQNLPASLPQSVTTRITQESELLRSDTMEGLQREDPRLNPSDATFGFHPWAQYLIRALEKDGIRPTRSRFVFKDLNLIGSGHSVHLQQNVGSILRVPFGFKVRFKNRHATEKLILKDFNGTIKQGEMLLVLGRPGSGCTTFLKSICGQLQGLKMSDDSIIRYDGIPQNVYHKEFRGEILYN
jgi:ATP-binding cassette, subfamily G (WHITE), member 2, PDR